MVVYPRATADDLRVTWIGQATFLIQMGGLNVLTDPLFSRRASPQPWLGPARLTAPGLAFEKLPPIDVVIISHDHYDHLDRPSVRRLVATFPDAQWIAPLNHGDILGDFGVRKLRLLDWWDEMTVGDVRVTATPSQHWTRRVRSPMRARLWFSCVLQTGDRRLYFSGDSGYCPAFAEIGERFGSFDVALLPIGAYEPRWFMKYAHMNPEEAVQAYLDLRARHFVAMHWATFRLTDEHPLEPAERARAAWLAAGLAPELLHVLGVGGTLVAE